MSVPVRLQLSRKRGFNLQELSRATNGLEAVKVDRATFWGNPFRIDGMSKENDFWLHYTALTMSDEEAKSSLDERSSHWRTTVLARIAEIRGMNLACWCALPQPYERDKCHARTLLELANSPLSPVRVTT